MLSELRNLSRHQYALLREIHSTSPTMEELKAYRDPTLYSLFRLAYIAVRVGRAVLTAAGIEAMDAYSIGPALMRKAATDLTSRTLALLALARRRRAGMADPLHRAKRARAAA